MPTLARLGRPVSPLKCAQCVNKGGIRRFGRSNKTNAINIICTYHQLAYANPIETVISKVTVISGGTWLFLFEPIMVNNVLYNFVCHNKKTAATISHDRINWWFSVSFLSFFARVCFLFCFILLFSRKCPFFSRSVFSDVSFVEHMNWHQTCLMNATYAFKGCDGNVLLVI